MENRSPHPYAKLHEKKNEQRNQSLTFSRVGVFARLTNSYAIVAVGASENFYRYDKKKKKITR